MIAFFKKNRRWILAGLAVALMLGGLGWQLYASSDWAVRDACLDQGGAWKNATCTFR